MGDELRLVAEKNLRLPPAKGAFAYKVEMGMVVIVLTWPLAVLTVVNARTTATRSNAFIVVLLVAVALFVLRLELLFNYARLFKYSGFVVILKLSTVYLVPIVLLIVATSPTVVTLGGKNGWKSMAAAWIAAKCLSLPFLYAMKVRVSPPTTPTPALGLFVHLFAMPLVVDALCVWHGSRRTASWARSSSSKPRAASGSWAISWTKAAGRG